MGLTVIMDNKFNNGLTCTTEEHYITTGIVRNLNTNNIYLIVPKKRRDTVYPNYVLTLGEVGRLRGAIYITDSRLRAQKAVKLGLKPVLLDCNSSMGLKGKYTLKLGIVRIMDITGFMCAMRTGWFG